MRFLAMHYATFTLRHSKLLSKRQSLKDMKQLMAESQSLMATSWKELLFIKEELVDKYGFKGVVFVKDMKKSQAETFGAIYHMEIEYCG